MDERAYLSQPLDVLLKVAQIATVLDTLANDIACPLDTHFQTHHYSARHLIKLIFVSFPLS
jgi:hypothetical protein